MREAFILKLFCSARKALKWIDVDLRRIRMRIFVRMRQAAVATRQPFLRFRSAAERIYMDNRIAMVSIIVDNGDSVARLNEVLHEYSDHIIGRMGIPYREAGLNLISIAACAPVDRINALTGRLGRLPGVSAKAVYAPAKRRDEE